MYILAVFQPVWLPSLQYTTFSRGTILKTDAVSHSSNAIQRRFVLLLVAILSYIVVLVLFSILNSMALKKDLVEVEDFYDLSNSVLELRRYEKNLLFEVGSDNYSQFQYYINLITLKLAEVEAAVSRVTNEQELQQFGRDLVLYQEFIQQGHDENLFDESEIRRLGKNLVDFTQGLVEKKKDQIHRALRASTTIYLVSVCLAFIVVALLVYFQVKSVLHRLRLLHGATQDVVHGSFEPLKDENGTNDEISTLIRAFNTMVAEIETQQEQLLQSKKLAAIGTFSSGIAHELNNPLNNISLTADTLKEEYDDLERDEAMELISDITAQTERASDVVSNLLEFSRKGESGETVISLKEVLDKTQKLIRNQMRIQSVWFENYIPDDLPPVSGDFKKLQQAFLNLFLNSLHVMPEGGLIHLEGKIDPPGYVCIEVSDTGSGIAADKLERIFDPFFTTKPVGQGTGLGLSIVYGIIHKLGGFVEVRSKVNIGTTFSIHLPVAPGEGKP